MYYTIACTICSHVCVSAGTMNKRPARTADGRNTTLKIGSIKIGTHTYKQKHLMKIGSIKLDSNT